MMLGSKWSALGARLAFASFSLVLAFTTSGCFAAGHHSSPWEWGLGARVAPGFPVGQGDLTAHPMVSYTYLDFEGGHDALYELGGQIRKPLSRRAGQRPLWVGVEGAVSHLKTVIDAGGGYTYSQGTNGVSAAALVGAPLGQSRWGFNLYGGFGISHYASTGINIRAGVDLQPWFLSK
jgi:hypothetical protein